MNYENGVKKKMAQAIKSKDVRKNCINVEQVIIECLKEPEREEINVISEPIQSKKLNKKILKFTSEYNGNYLQELVPINRVKQNLAYKNDVIY